MNIYKKLRLEIWRTAILLLAFSFISCIPKEKSPKRNNGTIARILHINTKTLERLKQRFVEEGFDACMGKKPYPEVTNIKADGDFEAHLIALSCSKAPEGFARWSLRLLYDKMVELKYVDSISHKTVRKTLKKRNQTEEGSRIIPPLQSGDFVS